MLMHFRSGFLYGNLGYLNPSLTSDKPLWGDNKTNIHAHAVHPMLLLMLGAVHSPLQFNTNANNREEPWNPWAGLVLVQYQVVMDPTSCLGFILPNNFVKCFIKYWWSLGLSIVKSLCRGQVQAWAGPMGVGLVDLEPKTQDLLATLGATLTVIMDNSA